MLYNIFTNNIIPTFLHKMSNTKETGFPDIIKGGAEKISQKTTNGKSNFRKILPQIHNKIKVYDLKKRKYVTFERHPITCYRNVKF